MEMKDRLLAMRFFARAARRKSLTAAGRELGMTQPVTSRLINALEEQLGVTLFRRTTRSVILTEAGETYLQRVDAILAAIDEADQEVRTQDQIRGTLRIGVCSSFLARVLLPGISRFIEQYPALAIEFVADDRLQDLVVEGLDLALRWSPGATLRTPAQPLGQSRRLLLASPAYLRQRQDLQSPADLGAHTLILTSTWRTPVLTFKQGTVSRSVKVRPRLMINLGEVALAAAIAGEGIVCVPELIGRKLIEEGVLVPVLGDWDIGPYALYAVYHVGKTPKAAAKAFIRFVADLLSSEPVGASGGSGSSALAV